MKIADLHSSFFILHSSFLILVRGQRKNEECRMKNEELGIKSTFDLKSRRPAAGGWEGTHAKGSCEPGEILTEAAISNAPLCSGSASPSHPAAGGCVHRLAGSRRRPPATRSPPAPRSTNVLSAPRSCHARSGLLPLDLLHRRRLLSLLPPDAGQADPPGAAGR